MRILFLFISLFLFEDSFSEAALAAPPGSTLRREGIDPQSITLMTLSLNDRPIASALLEERAVRFSTFQLPIHPKYNYPLVAWSPLDRPLDVRFQLRELDKFNSFAFPVADLNPAFIYRMHLKIRMSKTSKVYTVSHIIPHPHYSEDWVNLRFVDFVSSERSHRDQFRLDVDEYEIIEVGFSATARAQTDITEIPFTLASEIQIATALNEGTRPSDIVGPTFRHLSSIHSFDAEAPLHALDRFFEEAQKTENQTFAVERVKGGKDLVERSLREFGFSIVPYRQYTTGFIKTAELNGLVGLSEIIDMLRYQRIPLEAGPFSTLHGTWGHVLQFLSGMHGLTFDERIQFHKFFEHFNAIGVMWDFWNILFDARDTSIYSNRYWRELAILKGISAPPGRQVQCETLLSGSGSTRTVLKKSH